ncbi:hypothetical protein OAS39_02295 [Pirellulales bacterium]|nr:hypothetical protein [Pirellulales bacterium]
MEVCVLDTDILSELLKGRNQAVTDSANAYLKEHGEFAISAFTHFEVVRGFRWQKATAKLAAFEQLCQAMTIYPVSADILDRAAARSCSRSMGRRSDARQTEDGRRHNHRGNGTGAPTCVGNG